MSQSLNAEQLIKKALASDNPVRGLLLAGVLYRESPDSRGHMVGQFADWVTDTLNLGKEKATLLNLVYQFDQRSQFEAMMSICARQLGGE